MKAPLVTVCAREAIAASGILDNKYFALVENGMMTLPQFKSSQEQFFFAVNYFPRPMAALIARIPSARARINILQNLVEEHGEFEEQAFHCTTFKRFLASLSVENAETMPAMMPGVHAFNSALMGVCANDEVEVAIACLGSVEFAFSTISARIAQAVVDRGWVAPDKLVHYCLHAELDEKHADDFFAVIEESFLTDKRILIEQGVRLGLYCLDRLYTDMLDHGRKFTEVEQSLTIAE
jgi:pyrroloquinoline-quinone synthase